MPWDEVHDLRSTATAVDCWIGIKHRPHAIYYVIFATSRASGWALPAVREIIRR